MLVPTSYLSSREGPCERSLTDDDSGGAVIDRHKGDREMALRPGGAKGGGAPRGGAAAGRSPRSVDAQMKVSRRRSSLRVSYRCIDSSTSLVRISSKKYAICFSFFYGVFKNTTTIHIVIHTIPYLPMPILRYFSWYDKYLFEELRDFFL